LTLGGSGAATGSVSTSRNAPWTGQSGTSSLTPATDRSRIIEHSSAVVPPKGHASTASVAFLAIEALRSAFVYAFQWTLHIRPRPSFWLGCTGKSAAGASCASIPNRADPTHLRLAPASGVAALRFAKDRDLGKLEATLARLDAEAAAAAARPSRVPTAAQARAYLESLPELWAKTSDAGRHAIAEAVFERIDVLGARDYTFTLTAAAKARGWDAAFGPGVVRLAQGGRGKTGGSDAAGRQGVLSTKEGQSGRGERI
jgi:hypothetical protein